MIEATITLCDSLNPDFGYQVNITNNDGTCRRHILITSVAPDTGKDITTFAECVRILKMYV